MSRRSALIPVRGILLGKTRLAQTFPPELRSQLVEQMAREVVGAAVASHVFDDVVVVSARTDLLYEMLVEYPSIHVVEQPDHLVGLNPALDLGRSWARVQGASCLTIISADLPNLQPDDIRTLTETRSDVVIATDHAGSGTNGLVLNGANVLEHFTFGFGLGSRYRHLQEAEKLHAQAEIVTMSGFAFDLDTVEDWDQLSESAQQRLLGPIVSPSELVVGQ